MDKRDSNERQVTYIPAVPIAQITVRHTMGRVPIAKESNPDAICGLARRVGYTGTSACDLAIYRLKVKERRNDNAMMLPMLYVVDEGFFVDYEEWRQKREIVQD